MTTRKETTAPPDRGGWRLLIGSTIIAVICSVLYARVGDATTTCQNAMVAA